MDRVGTLLLLMIRPFMVTKNKNNHKNYPIFITLLTLMLIGGFFVFASGNQSQSAKAQSASNLRQKIEQLESEIEESEEHAEDLHSQAQTLQKAVDELNGQITTAQNQIDLTNLKIQEISSELEETRKELEEQKAILSKSLREHYKMGDVSTLELFASAENFSEFFNQKEYLDRVRSNIHESSKEVAKLEESLEAQKLEQEELLDEQEAQKRALAAKKQQKDSLLVETRGREAEYRQLVARLENEREEVEEQLRAKLAAGNFVSMGPVSKGDIVGKVGNTGYSSGNHLHLEARTPDGYITNPNQFLGSSWIEPVERPPAYITQHYGDTDTSSSHSGIDYGDGGRGVPVRAVASGSIIHRGCSGDSDFFRYNPAYGYSVIIQHSSGHFSVYGHMSPPASGYEQCSSSYGF